MHFSSKIFIINPSPIICNCSDSYFHFIYSFLLFKSIIQIYIGGHVYEKQASTTFPTIQDRNEILTTISSQPNLSAIFNAWSTEQQNEFLDCCTGVKGIKLLSVDEHFVEVNKTIEMPKSAEKEILDYELSRYACYLIVQNGDSRKKVIALG